MPARRNPPALIALACLAAFVLCGLLAYGSDVVQEWDRDVLQRFVEIRETSFTRALDELISVADELAVAVMAFGLAMIAAVRGRYRLAVLVPLSVGVSVATCHVLKQRLAEPRHAFFLGWAQQIGEASWPSGHSTAACALAICAVLVAAPRWRPLAALVGAAFTLAMAAALLVRHWHYPSDIVGGWLCAGMWITALAAIARPVMAESELGPPRQTRLWIAAAGLATGALVLAAIAALGWPSKLGDGFSEHTVVGVGLILAMAFGAVWSAVLAGLGDRAT